MSSDPLVNPDSPEPSHEAAADSPAVDGATIRPPGTGEGAPPGAVAGPEADPTGRLARKVVVLGVVGVVLTVAGLSIAQSLREADWLVAAIPQARALGVGSAIAQPPAPPQPAAAPSSEGDPSERCTLQVFRGEPKGETIVLLSAPGRMTEARPGHVGNHSRLARELVRQAVLVAAREELNLAVRDAAIGDPVPKGRPDTVIDVAVLCPSDKTSVRLSRGEGEKREILFERILRDSGRLNDHQTLTRNAEAASRVGIPAALRKAGLKARAAAKPGKGEVPPGVEDALLKMSFVTQFGALRQLHGAIRADGPSPERLQGLARGYANLGVLTDHQWDAASQAYKARGLLYAQRDLVARPKAPAALWGRAYAAALAGAHVLALRDLELAGRLAAEAEAAGRLTPPAWVGLIDAHCRNNVKKFAEARTDALAEMEAFLYMLTVERPSDSDLALNAARGSIEVSPDCFRAHDSLCEVGGVSNLHTATTMAPAILDRLVPGRIAALAGLPESVRNETEKADEGGQNEVAITRALDAAAESARDLAEPSWGALAKIVRETRFVCTFRRLSFMVEWWSVPTGDYWQEVWPLVADHRFRPFLETYVRGIQVDQDFLAWVRNLDTTDLGMNAWKMSLKFRQVVSATSQTSLYGISAALSDWTAHDLAIALMLYKSSNAVEYARKLLSVSPNSAYAMGILVENNWDEAEKRVEGWRKTVGDHPSLIGPLGRRYDKLGRTDEAEVLLKRYIELSPDPWAYKLLANRAKALGNEPRWKAILDEYLADSEDHGLDHARIRVEIAEALMAKERFDEARPYADAAAETWAGWAMQTAQRCAEGQKDWKAAEKWAAARASRYPSGSAYDWLEFCERTGQGDLDRARDFTIDYLGRFGEDGGDQVVLPLASLQMLSGEYNKTYEPLERLIKEKAGDPSGHQAALVTLLVAAGQAGDRARLDATAGQFLGLYSEQSPRFAGILAKVRDAIAKDDPDTLDLKGIDAFIEDTPAPNRCGPALLVASYLAGCDRHDKAKPYWEQAADPSRDYFWWRLIAHGKLRQRYR